MVTAAPIRYAPRMLRLATIAARLLPLPLAGALLASCATGSRQLNQGQAVPADFAVSISVPQGDAKLEPAWYVLEADGTLRAALGQATPQSPVPPRVRTLTPGARAAVWDAVQQAHWVPGTAEQAAEQTSEQAPADAALSQPKAVLAEVYVAANGGRWSGLVVDAPDSPAAKRLERVIRELRRLAWLDQKA